MEAQKIKQLIEKNFNHENGSGLRASVSHYAESGKPSGSMLLAIKQFLKDSIDSDIKWYSQSHRPEKKELNFSRVLLYSPGLDLHSIGWFDFDHDKWCHISNAAMEDFVWTYLPKPTQ